MTTIELKNILIHKISAINDESFLNAINTIIDTKSETTIYKTTNRQKNQIKEGLEQLKKGEVFTDEQVESEIEKWLDKK
jgi:predicted transcriptional regulator